MLGACCWCPGSETRLYQPFQNRTTRVWLNTAVCAHVFADYCCVTVVETRASLTTRLVIGSSLRAPRGYLEQIWIRTRLINLPGTVIVKRRTPVRLRGSFPPLCLEAMSLRGYFVAFSKCALLLCLRILLLVPAGLPVRSQGDSQSDNRVMDNITVRQGETVFLRWVHTLFFLLSFCALQLSTTSLKLYAAPAL